MLERVPQHAKALFRRGQARLALKACRPLSHARQGPAFLTPMPFYVGTQREVLHFSRVTSSAG